MFLFEVGGGVIGCIYIHILHVDIKRNIVYIEIIISYIIIICISLYY